MEGNTARLVEPGRGWCVGIVVALAQLFRARLENGRQRCLITMMPGRMLMAAREDKPMNSGRSRNWMWADAVDLLDQVQRLNKESFAPARGTRGAPAWEPPVDMLETENEVLVLVALPGVDLDKTEATIDGGLLVVSGQRILPAEVRTAKIHRLELPQGRFERRLPLPPGRYEAVRRSSLHGCLLVTLHKAQGGPRS